MPDVITLWRTRSMLVVRIIWDEYKPFELSYKMPIKDGGEREKTQKPYREIVSFFFFQCYIGQTNHCELWWNWQYGE